MLRKFRIRFFLIIIAVLFIGCIWQTIASNRELKLLRPPGELYSVNSHDMHMYAAGHGDTTIVFVPGSGTPSAYTDFYYLQSQLQNHARTVSYDHPGFGWSEPAMSPRTIDNIVQELHELLKQANEAPPYLLVGHSLASLEVIHYAQRYPDEVTGIVLLDSGSPEYYADDSELKYKLLNRTLAGLRRSGIVRALGEADVLLPFSGENVRYKRLPVVIQDIDIAMYYGKLGNKSNLDVIKHINENAQTVIDGGDLVDIPLLVISSESGEDWKQVQRELLKWSNNSQQITIPDSAHYIHWSNQDTIRNEIIDILNKET